MRIVGASFDMPEANAAFRERHGFGFELWTDSDRQLALAYGAARSATSRVARRNTVLLASDGTLLRIWDGVTNVLGHPQAVYEDCQVLFGPEAGQ